MKSSSYPKPSTSTIALLLLPIALLALVALVIYPNESKLHFATTACAGILKPHAGLVDHVNVRPDVRLLIGVLTVPDRYARRSLLRLAYAHQPGPGRATARVDIRFVFCNLTREEDKVLVALEILRHDDIVVLDCAENMDGGKTYTFFSSLPNLFPGKAGGEPPYDYVMKTDDDSYPRLGNLVESLATKPRQNLYYGLMTPCFGSNDKLHWMSGLGYVVSWDLIEWIAASDVVRDRRTGPEDVVTGKWFAEGGRAVNMYDATPGLYDYMELPYRCFRHEFIPETLAVHKLKDNLRWAKTLKYFNVTTGLKPSKFYHIPSEW